MHNPAIIGDVLSTGLYAITFSHGSLIDYLMRVWGLSLRQAEEYELYFESDSPHTEDPCHDLVGDDPS